MFLHDSFVNARARNPGPEFRNGKFVMIFCRWRSGKRKDVEDVKILRSFSGLWFRLAFWQRCRARMSSSCPPAPPGTAAKTSKVAEGAPPTNRYGWSFHDFRWTLSICTMSFFDRVKWSFDYPSDHHWPCHVLAGNWRPLFNRNLSLVKMTIPVIVSLVPLLQLKRRVVLRQLPKRLRQRLVQQSPSEKTHTQ